MSSKPEITLAGNTLQPRLSGALFWPTEKALLVADLHLEKAAAFAAKGSFLPPYDSRATLKRLQSDIDETQPERVILLGDSFHRDEGATSLGLEERTQLDQMSANRDWVWIAGNHDPAAHQLAGTCTARLMLANLELVHEPTLSDHPQIAGHLHPAAKLEGNGHTVRRPCFVSDGTRLILPSFGVLTGGLSIFHPAFDGLLDHKNLHVIMRGKRELYPVSNTYLKKN